MKSRVFALLVFMLMTPVAFAYNGNDYWWDTSHAPTAKTKLVVAIVDYINVTYPDLNLSLPGELWVHFTATGANFSSEGWGWLFINCTGFIWFETPDFRWEGRGWVEDGDIGIEELLMVQYEPEPEPEPELENNPESEPKPEPEPDPPRTLGRVVYEDGLTPLVMWNTPHFLVAINLRNGAVDDGGRKYAILLVLSSEPDPLVQNGSVDEIIRRYEMKPIHKYLCVYFKQETIDNLGSNYQIQVYAFTKDGVSLLNYNAYESAQHI